jgi:hypothetical protein
MSLHGTANIILAGGQGIICISGIIERGALMLPGFMRRIPFIKKKCGGYFVKE